MSEMSWRSHYKATILLAAPVCLSNVGHMFVDLTDNYFVGQLPEKTAGQAAVSLAGVFYIQVLVFLIGLSYALTPIVASANAKNDTQGIIRHLRHAFVLNLACSLLLITILFFARPLVHLSSQPDAVADLSIRFLSVIMYSMIPLSLFFTLKQFAEGMSDTKAAMYLTIAANILNILLNYALVFGNWGFPQLGVMGSCWATFIARFFMAAGMMVYIFNKKKYRIYRPAFRIGNYTMDIFRQQIKIGVPSALMFVMEVAAFAMPALFIPDTNQLAAHRISLSLASMTYMVSSGLSAAATIRVGHFRGLNEKLGYRRAGFSAIFLALIFMGIAAICFMLFRHQLASIFNDDPNVVNYASYLLLIAAVFQLFDGMQVTAQGALRGLEDSFIPGIIAFVSYWLIGLPASWIFCIKMGMGATGVWYGYVLGLVVVGLGFLWRFNRLARA
jgi:multidrug resistance protein, MATE family